MVQLPALHFFDSSKALIGYVDLDAIVSGKEKDL
jgi:hypothetical protein